MKRLFFAVCLFVLLPWPLLSQQPLVWNKTMNGCEGNFCPDHQGNVFVALWACDGGLNYVVKYDSSGSTLWTSPFSNAIEFIGYSGNGLYAVVDHDTATTPTGNILINRYITYLDAQTGQALWSYDLLPGNPGATAKRVQTPSGSGSIKYRIRTDGKQLTSLKTRKPGRPEGMWTNGQTWFDSFDLVDDSGNLLIGEYPAGDCAKGFTLTKVNASGRILFQTSVPYPAINGLHNSGCMGAYVDSAANCWLVCALDSDSNVGSTETYSYAYSVAVVNSTGGIALDTTVIMGKWIQRGEMNPVGTQALAGVFGNGFNRGNFVFASDDDSMSYVGTGDAPLFLDTHTWDIYTISIGGVITRRSCQVGPTNFDTLDNAVYVGCSALTAGVINDDGIFLSGWNNWTDWPAPFDTMQTRGQTVVGFTSGGTSPDWIDSLTGGTGIGPQLNVAHTLSLTNMVLNDADGSERSPLNYPEDPNFNQLGAEMAAGDGYCIYYNGYVGQLLKFDFSYQLDVLPNSRWHLISLPYATADAAVASVFPGTLGPAYEFDGSTGYNAVSTLQDGAGYWVHVKANTPMLNTPTQDVLSSVTVNVAPGWNLLGSVSSSTMAEYASSVPGGMETSKFFAYRNGAYIAADTIRPGEGYWIKVSEPGTLTMSGGFGKSEAQNRIHMSLTDANPPPPPAGEKAPVSTTAPKQFRLEQNYPNPFNPTTRISFTIPADEYTTLQIYNILGQRIADLEHGMLRAGNYGITWNAVSAPSGVYFCVLKSGNYAGTRKLLVMK